MNTTTKQLAVLLTFSAFLFIPASICSAEEKVQACIDRLAALKKEMNNETCKVLGKDEGIALGKFVYESGTCTKAGLALLKAPDLRAKALGSAVFLVCKAKQLVTLISESEKYSDKMKDCKAMQEVLESNREICKDKQTVIIMSDDGKQYLVVSLAEGKVLASYPPIKR